MKTKKRLFSPLLALSMILTLFSGLTVTAHAAENPYPYWQTFPYNGRDYTTITCTYHAWQQAYDNGFVLPSVSWGNAGSWLDSARAAGYEVGTEARKDSIAVWKPTAGNAWGHVGYVTSASNGGFTYNEGGSANWRANSIGIYEGHPWPDGYTSRPDGFIYLKNQQTGTQSGEKAVHFSEDFYGRIRYGSSCLRAVETPTQDGEGQGYNVCVTTKPNQSDPYQVWHFLRLSDNSYKIVNMGTGGCLDVQTGKVKDKQNVWTWSIDHGDAPEKWRFVSAPGQSGCRLVTALDSNFCIDIPGGNVYEGANAEIYTRNQNPWQFFTITRIANYTPPSASDKTNSGTASHNPATPQYTAWSDWSTSSPENKTGREIETQEVTEGYNMIVCVTQQTDYNRNFRSSSVNGNYSGNGLRASYGEHIYRRYASKADVDAAATCSPGTYVPQDSSHVGGIYKGAGTAYFFNDDGYYWYIESPVTRTEFRFRELI